MSQKSDERKLKMFINEPSFLKNFIQRSHQPINKADSLKSIFPPSPQLERFRHLENARMTGQRNHKLDEEVEHLIKQFEKQVFQNQRIDQELENKKQNCLKKLKMDYVEEQMTQNLDQLQNLILEYQQLTVQISSEKGYVQKVHKSQEQMITITEIKKALRFQNSILKKENEMLKKQEEEVDALVKSKGKR